MRRIGLVVVLLVSLFLTPLVVEAQQVGKLPRLGILWPYSSTIAAPFADAFRQGLRDAGYVEGRNIVVEERWAEVLATLRMPCLLYAGDADGRFASAKGCVTHIPKATFFSLPGLSHPESFFRSDLVLPSVMRFLVAASSHT